MKKHLKVMAIIAVSLVLFTQTLLAENSLAPDFRLTDINQKTVSLSEYRDRQPVLLFFWTTWCPFCLKQLEILNDKANEVQRDNLEILAISVGEKSDKVARFAKVHHIPFKVLLDKDNAVAGSYRILGVPTYILVDGKGKIISRDNSFPAYKKLLNKINR